MDKNCVIKYFKLKEEHIEGLCSLDELCFNIPWTKKMFYEELKNDRALYFVAVLGEQVVGYGGIWVVLDEAQITNIAVHPDFRRMKVASTLLKKLIVHCNEKKLKQITLEVRVGNVSAINLYQKHGFSKVGLRKKYYADNLEDALIMTAKLLSYF